MSINYDYYRIFYYVARYKSFTQAANVLMNSQPNITRAIKNLEQEIGCTLFIRTNRTVQLTPEGEALYRHVSIAFEQLQAGEEEIAKGKGLEGGILRIAATEVALRTFLLPVLKQFRTQYPHVHIKLINCSTPAAIADLEQGLADLAVITTPANVKSGIKSTALKSIQEIAVCGSSYASLSGHPVSLAELSYYPIISLGDQSSTYQYYSKLFADHRLPFDPDIEAATADQILLMVKANLGIGFVPKDFLSSAADPSVFPLDLVEAIPPRTVCLLESGQYAIGPAARELKKLSIAASTLP